jgi:hypothetical protein
MRNLPTRRLRRGRTGFRFLAGEQRFFFSSVVLSGLWVPLSVLFSGYRGVCAWVKRSGIEAPYFLIALRLRMSEARCSPICLLWPEQAYLYLSDLRISVLLVQHSDSRALLECEVAA